MGLASPALGADAPARAAPTLPLPPAHGAAAGATLEALLGRRRSVRRFAAEALELPQIGRLLWAAQGISDERGRRTAPSAGALYPLSLVLVCGTSGPLEAGAYRYRPEDHALQPQRAGDLRAQVAAIAAGQAWIAQAAAIVVFVAPLQRTAERYGARAARYVAIEVGAAAQNLLLQAVSLGLGGTPVGAFDDAALAQLLQLSPGEQAWLMVPLGRAR